MLNSQLIDAIDLWKTYYLKKGSSFWIHHKNGNMGRPYDAQYILEQICIKDDAVEITYDSYRKVLIHNPSKIELSRDKVGNIRLIFSGFSFLEAVLVDYDIDAPKSDDFRHIRTQSADDELRLVGHSPDISDPLSVADADYQALFMKARLSQNW